MNTKEKFIGFEAVKQSVSMVQILDRYGLLDRLYRSGDNLSGACPIHAGHNQNQFRVSISKNCWICFGDCHAGGSIVDFVSRKEGVGIRDAALLIQDWFGIRPRNSEDNGKGPHTKTTEPDVRQELPPVAVNPPLRFTLAGLDKTHPYFAERGLSEETIQTFGLGYCSSGWLAGWIIIPVHNRSGQLVAYAARWPATPSNGQPKYQLPRGFRKSLVLFNQHRALSANPNLPLIVVEGFFGCMRIWQAGYPNVVATMGSMVSEGQAELIRTSVGPNSRVTVLFDEDEAGRKGRTEALMRLGESVKVKILSFDSEGTQPDRLSSEEILRLLR